MVLDEAGKLPSASYQIPPYLLSNTVSFGFFVFFCCMFLNLNVLHLLNSGSVPHSVSFFAISVSIFFYFLNLQHLLYSILEIITVVRWRIKSIQQKKSFFFSKTRNSIPFHVYQLFPCILRRNG